MTSHYNPSRAFLALTRSFRRFDTSDPLTQCLVPQLRRSFASQRDFPVDDLAKEIETELNLDASSAFQTVATEAHSTSDLITTVYSWPYFEPLKYASYKPEHLGLPLRRDILHRAVIYEGDSTRQGTASTKWRADVHGSNRKIRPQKGSGQARLGDKKSPMLRGGGVAFGPRPGYKHGVFFNRFATELPRKIYDIAWRTALSYRYRKGDLIVVESEMSIPEGMGGRFLSNMFEANNWSQRNGWSLLITYRNLLDADAKQEDRDTKTHLKARKENREPSLTGTQLLEAMKTFNVDETPKQYRKPRKPPPGYVYRRTPKYYRYGEIKDLEHVDVKDLLDAGRVVIEKRALDYLLRTHGSDIGRKVTVGSDYEKNGPALLHSN